MIPISAKTNFGKKAKMKIRIYRATTGEWKELSFWWQIKNLLKGLKVGILEKLKSGK